MLCLPLTFALTTSLLACGAPSEGRFEDDELAAKGDSAELESLAPDRVSRGDPLHCDRGGVHAGATLFSGIQLVRFPLSRELFAGAVLRDWPLWYRFDVRAVADDEAPLPSELRADRLRVEVHSLQPRRVAEPFGDKHWALKQPAQPAAELHPTAPAARRPGGLPAYRWASAGAPAQTDWYDFTHGDDGEMELWVVPYRVDVPLRRFEVTALCDHR